MPAIPYTTEDSFFFFFGNITVLLLLLNHFSRVQLCATP